MRTALHKRSLLRSYAFLPKKKLLNGATKRKLKRIYRTSLENVRHYPLRSIGILTFGLGVLTGLFLLFRLKK